MRSMRDILDEAAKKRSPGTSKLSERMGTVLGLYWALDQRLGSLKASRYSDEPGLHFADTLIDQARNAIDLLGNEASRLGVAGVELDFEEAVKNAARRADRTIESL